jgi:hypothetical protein
MESFLNQAFDSILSKSGVLDICLIVILVYTANLLKIERAENKKLNNQILELATGQVSAMNELQNVLKCVMNLLPIHSKD